MELRKLAADCKDRDLLEEINHEAFPPSERMNTEELFQFAQRTDTDILGISTYAITPSPEMLRTSV